MYLLSSILLFRFLFLRCFTPDCRRGQGTTLGRLSLLLILRVQAQIANITNQALVILYANRVEIFIILKTILLKLQHRLPLLPLLSNILVSLEIFLKPIQNEAKELKHIVGKYVLNS